MNSLNAEMFVRDVITSPKRTLERTQRHYTRVSTREKVAMRKNLLRLAFGSNDAAIRKRIYL